MTPTRAQLEAQVVVLADTLRRGGKVEDDRVELKQVWPDPPMKAVRRLAASANRARGEDVIWVVGLDEGGAVHQLDDKIEAGRWVEGLKRWFDEDVMPDLALHVAVPLDSGAVQALLFRTDRAPYVVKLADGQRDVPIRSGGNTRSAHRHELLRLLAPSAETPTAEIVEASMTAVYQPEVTSKDALDIASAASVGPRPASLYLHGLVHIFLTLSNSRPAMLPRRRMSASLIAANQEIPLGVTSLEREVRSSPTSATGMPRPRVHGIAQDAEGVSVHGPGHATLRLGHTAVPSEWWADLVQAETCTLSVEMRPADTDRRIELSVGLRELSQGHILEPPLSDGADHLTWRRREWATDCA